jgi:D-ribose pyranose/furanose isomerase RbsD
MASPQNHLVIRFSVTHGTPHVSCASTAVTTAAVIENVCLSRRWKAQHIMFRSCIQTLASSTHLVAQKPDLASI